MKKEDLFDNVLKIQPPNENDRTDMLLKQLYCTSFFLTRGICSCFHQPRKRKTYKYASAITVDKTSFKSFVKCILRDFEIEVTKFLVKIDPLFVIVILILTIPVRRPSLNDVTTLGGGGIKDFVTTLY